MSLSWGPPAKISDFPVVSIGRPGKTRVIWCDSSWLDNSIPYPNQRYNLNFGFATGFYSPPFIFNVGSAGGVAQYQFNRQITFDAGNTTALTNPLTFGTWDVWPIAVWIPEPGPPTQTPLRWMLLSP
jgi:hypothetical protein